MCETCVFGGGVNIKENLLWDFFGFGLENLRAFTTILSITIGYCHWLGFVHSVLAQRSYLSFATFPISAFASDYCYLNKHIHNEMSKLRMYYTSGFFVPYQKSSIVTVIPVYVLFTSLSVCEEKCIFTRGGLNVLNAISLLVHSKKNEPR